MGIAGTDHAITQARSGMLRSGAGRSGWPILQGVKVPLYALSGVGRSGAMRSNYHSTKTFISIGGVHVAHGPASIEAGVLDDSLSIQDTLNDAPNTASLKTKGFYPTAGQEVIITLGSKNNLQREFAGTVLIPTQSYVGDRRENFQHQLPLIDYTWGLGQRRVRTRFLSTTVSAILASLISVYAPGYTLVVDPDVASLPIDEITFGDEDELPSCLSRLMKRVGGNWYCDYHRVVRAFLVDRSQTAPTELNAVHRSLTDLSFSVDLSQVITRVRVEGGGTNALEAIAVGETLLPVQNAVWYPLGGGIVVVGPQRLTYTSVELGGGGGLVGPGAAPTGVIALMLASGAGVETGLHRYGTTFVTASGESVVSPLSAITVGTLEPPLSAPVAATPTIGTGPDPGSHDYVTTFVTSSGETIAGPPETQATTLTPAPSTAPTAGAPTSGGSVDDGPHDYAASFVTAIGETTPGPISGAVTTGPVIGSPVADPTTAPTVDAVLAGGNVNLGAHSYAITWGTDAGETVPSPIVVGTADEMAWWSGSPVGSAPSTGGSMATGVSYDYRVSAVCAAGETLATLNSLSGVALTGAENAVALSNVLTALDGRCTARKIYRRDANTGDYLYVGTIANNTTTTFLDTVPTASRGAAALVSSTALYGTIVLANLPVGVAGTDPVTIAPSYKHIYRTVAGGSQLKRVATLSNGTTSYSDTRPDTDSATFAVSSLTRILGTVTVTTTGAHGFRSGDKITIAGADQPDYNGEVSVSVTGLTTFTYSISSAPVTPATGTITAVEKGLGANAPTSNTTAATTHLNTIHVTGIPRGDATVTGRKLYRRSGGAGLRLLVTFTNNTDTSITDLLPNASLGAAPPAVSTAYLQRIALSAIPIGPALVTARKLYRTAAGGSQLKLLATIADNTTTTFLDTVTDASLGANVPTTNTATANQVALSGIPIGAAAVTSRKLYRTVAGGSQLKLLATIADNATTIYTDTVADASLGANVPTSDASGLPQPAGNVLAGATTLIVAGTGAFNVAGGWAVIGNGTQVIRYTGITGSSLTGIPASGVGSITATVGYNSNVTAAPCLRGIPPAGQAGSIQFAVLKGDPVNLQMQVDDLPAQAALAALLTTPTFTHDGIQEDALSDNRLSATECVARGRARLALRRTVQVSIRYKARDLNSRTGTTVPANLGPPTNLSGAFLIQRVTESQFHMPDLNPTFDVEASSDLFSFDDLLRLARKAGD